jgi:beta-phosphoglucomutase
MTMPASAAGPSARDVIRDWAALPRRGVIFDFNGTLSDDEPILLEIYAELFAEHLGWQMTAAEYYGTLAGRSDREIVETAVAERAGGHPGLTEYLLRRRREMYQSIVAVRSPITEAAAGLVGRLAAERVPVGIVTGAERADVRCVLDSSPVGEHIAALVALEDVTEGKPDPEGFLLGARALGLAAGQILVFEDSIPGITAATAAGMRCVAVTSTHGADQLSGITTALVPRLEAALLDV